MHGYVQLYIFVQLHIGPRKHVDTINHQSCLRVNKSKDLDAASSRWIRKETRRVGSSLLIFF